MTHSFYYYTKILGKYDPYHYHVEHNLDKGCYSRPSMDRATTIWKEDTTGVYLVKRIYKPNPYNPAGKSICGLEYESVDSKSAKQFTWAKLASVELRKGEFIL